MSCIRKNPLRPLKSEEIQQLRHLSLCSSESASIVAHAKEILAIHDGRTYAEAARQAGRSSRHMVSDLVKRFNKKGIDALADVHAGGPKIKYGIAERERILREFGRQPDRKKDGTATWSVETLKRTLRKASDGLPNVSHEIIWQTLHDAGLTYQRDRSWTRTGKVIRMRKSGAVEIVDQDAHLKKN